jgi:hypothetical protein
MYDEGNFNEVYLQGTEKRPADQSRGDSNMMQVRSFFFNGYIFGFISFGGIALSDVPFSGFFFCFSNDFTLSPCCPSALLASAPPTLQPPPSVRSLLTLPPRVRRFALSCPLSRCSSCRPSILVSTRLDDRAAGD